MEDSTKTLEGSDHQKILHTFVELLIKHARVWHLDDEDDDDGGGTDS